MPYHKINTKTGTFQDYKKISVVRLQHVSVFYRLSLISGSTLAVSSLWQEDGCQSVSLSLCLFIIFSLSLSLCPSRSSNPGFPHSPISLLCSTQLLHVLRHTENTHTLTHTYSIITQRHTHTPLLVLLRTRGGEKRVEEFGLKSCNRLQTAGNVELMSVCLSVWSSSLCLSVSLSLSCDDL